MNLSAFVIGPALAFAIGAVAAEDNATTPATPQPVPVPATSSRLVRDLGGQRGISTIVEVAYRHVQEDNRINRFFTDEQTVAEHKASMKTLLYTVLGGAGSFNTYDGGSMSAMFHDFHMTTGEYNAYLEDFNQAFQDCHTPYSAGERVLAVLLAMKRQVVTR